MDGSKEFQGKDLDAAIQDACLYFNTTREGLEIDILQDAKSGIFGIVGARKAKIRARRARLRDTVQSLLGELTGRDQPGEDGSRQPPKPEGQKARKPGPGKPEARSQKPEQGKPEAQPRKPDPGKPETKPQRPDPRPRKPEAKPKPQPQPKSQPQPKPQERREPGAPREGRPESRDAAGQKPPRQPRRQKSDQKPDQKPDQAAGQAPGQAPEPQKPRAEKPRQPRRRPSPDQEKPAPRPPRPEEQEPVPDEDSGCRPMEEADIPAVRDETLRVLRLLLAPLTETAPELDIQAEDGEIIASMPDAGNSAVLIGRDGATLAAVQYLAGRLVTHSLRIAVRVHLDIAGYRQRQAEDLREQALALAEKVRQTGRPLSTRPLSSFQRRIVHLALRDAEDLQTRSMGTGSLKRVLIQRRKAQPKAPEASRPESGSPPPAAETPS